MLDSIPEFLVAESECQQLYSEYDVSDQQKMNEMKMAGQHATTLPNGKTIFDVLNKEQTDLLNAKFNETFHVNLTDSVMKATWNYQPFVFPTTFILIFLKMAIFILIVITLLAFVLLLIGIFHYEKIDEEMAFLREIDVAIAILLGLPLLVLAWTMEICSRRNRG